MATKSWTGTGGSWTDNTWNPSNPTSTDDVIISGATANVTLPTGATTVNSLSVKVSGAIVVGNTNTDSVTAASFDFTGGQIKFGGTTGSLTLTATATGTTHIGTVVVVGSGDNGVDAGQTFSLQGVHTWVYDDVPLSGFTVLGTLVLGGGTYSFNGNGLFVAGLVTGSGTINATASFDDGSALVNVSRGTIVASGGVLELSGVQAANNLPGTYAIADVAASALKLDYVLPSSGGSSVVNFAATQTNAQTLTDATAGGTALNARVISNFAGSDTIVVTNATSFRIVDATHIAVLNGAGTIETLAFATSETFASAGTVINGSNLTAASACYLEGTNILTQDGEVAVNDLVIGDIVITADAGPQPIRWIGRRAYLARLVNEHHRTALMPIQISADALADNVPTHDLFVSPEHMIAVDGVLVAAHHLINGTTITRFEDLDVVKYFHIELDQHAVIFANGAPAESYLDTGNRNMFTNVVEYADLGMPVGSVVPCLPIVSEGPVLTAIRVGIADRATACGFTTSADADLHLQVDGAIVYPSAISGHSFSFDIAQSASDVRIVSRSAVPAEINPTSADGRRLGVAVAGLTLRGHGMSIEVLAGDKLLADGFYQADGGHRWTNGSAHVPAALLALMDGAFSVSVQLVGTDMQYPVAAQGDIVALASARVARNSVDQRLVA